MSADRTEPTERTDRTDPAGAAPPPGTSRRVDAVSLVAGLVLAVLCAAYALGDLGDLDGQARVVGPTILLGVGVALLATSRRR